jgi:serine phosphatase RsbU (regulator of sigma subunit)
MANLQANLRSQYAVALHDPSRLLRSVNQLLFENTTESNYATLFFADYDDASRRLRYANYGHNPPLLARAGGGVERLGATTTVLGLFEGWQCPMEEQTFHPEDTLAVYSDGVTEARSDEGEGFGDTRLIETVLKCRHLSSSELLDWLLETVQKFSGSEQEDDITLVVARRLTRIVRWQRPQETNTNRQSFLSIPTLRASQPKKDSDWRGESQSESKEATNSDSFWVLG